VKTLTRLFLAIFVLTLLAAAIPSPVHAAPDSAGLTRLTIVNKSDAKVYLKLEGSPVYSFTVLRHSTAEFTPQKGMYAYTLTACGQTVSGKLDLTIYRELTVPACGGQLPDYSNNHKVDLAAGARPMSLTIENQNTRTVYVSLKGQRSYEFKVAGKSSPAFSLEPGKYTYTVTACGTTVQGKLDMTRVMTMRIAACGASPTGAASQHEVFVSFNNLVKAGFENEISADVVVTLKGSKNYYFYIPAGTLKTFTMFRGAYSYEYTACGKLVKGKWEARNNQVLQLTCQ
jgi:hypothetical protein